MVFIYVLKLGNGKFYVGKTSNPQFRLDSHFRSCGSEWTRIHKPMEVLELIPNCDEYDEDKYTRMYMDRHGVDNVRGGSYVSVHLDSSTKAQLMHMSNGTNNRCFKCGEQGHFAKDCDIVWCCDYCDKEFETKQKCEHHEELCSRKYSLSNKRVCKGTCFRCGRPGHYVSDCYASKHADGSYLK
jgi:hypothetical protein